MGLTFKTLEDGCEFTIAGNSVVLNRKEMITVASALAIHAMKNQDGTSNSILLVTGAEGKPLLTFLDVRDKEVNENTVFEMKNPKKRKTKQ